MIRTLMIHDVALIESIQIHFNNGMQVLSGETGAGKSIIVDAVTLVLGGRADRDLIRTGCDKASVEAEFEIDHDQDLAAVLERENIEWDGHTVVIYREISMNGRNTCRINGVMISLGVLKEISSFLLNLHGQSEHQFLADEEKQMGYLDLMGDEAHQMLRKRVRDAYQDFISNHKTYAKMVKMNENRERRTDMLRRELEELQGAGIRSGEESKLIEESKHLHKASRIHEKISIISRLIGNGEDENSPLVCLKRAIREMNGLTESETGISALISRCENIYYELEEIAYEVNELDEQYDFDPAELDRVENRLDSVRKITKKYGPSEEDVLKNMDRIKKEYKFYEELEEQLEKTGADHKKLLAQYRSTAKALTESRKKIAASFEKSLMKELKDLGMEHAVMEVSFHEKQDGKPVMPSPDGDDRICFMISPNPGEPLKPISAIASGGELSRLMLAVKTIEAGRSGVKTMIFDEIDTGISGRMAQAVAEKMISISRFQQVICISHLPQTAAAADDHYLVYKQVENGRTRTNAEKLDRERRTDEIARMISGAEGITQQARLYAGQMIDASARIRTSQCGGTSVNPR